MIVETTDAFDSAVKTLERVPVLFVDTETKPIIPGSVPDLCGISIWAITDLKAGEEFGYYFPFRHGNSGYSIFGEPTNIPLNKMPALLRILETRTRVVFHNAKFDLSVLEKEGLDVSKINVIDTMIMAHMVNENEYSFALKSLGKTYLDDDAGKEEAVIKKISKQTKGDYSLIPPEILGMYAIKDVQLTAGLFNFLWPQMVQQKQDILLSEEMRYLSVLRKVERRGIKIDRELASSRAKAASARLKEILSELGFDPGKPSLLAERLYLPEPEGLGFHPQAYSKRKSKTFPSGLPVMDVHALEALLPYPKASPIVPLVLEYRGHQKALSTWFQGFLEKCGPDGRLHPSFKQHGTVTTRLSCSEPNLQQIPRSKEEEVEAGVSRSLVKQLFTADHGHCLWEFDYSQAEYRLAAAYSGDEHLIEAFHKGSDMHTLTADSVGITRQEAKTLNFAILYGAGAKKIALMLGITEEDALELVMNFWATYPGLSKAKTIATRKASNRGYVNLWNGRRRRFRFSSETHKAFNSVIQGGVAQIVKRSMITLDQEYPEIRMIGQVHDSIWFELPEESEKERKTIQDIMEWPGEKFGVPFPVDSQRFGS